MYIIYGNIYLYNIILVGGEGNTFDDSTFILIKTCCSKSI